MSAPARVLAAFRTRLVSDAGIQGYLGVDGPGTQCRVKLREPVDTEEPTYPLVVLFLEGDRQATWSPFTFDPGKLYVGVYSRQDQVEALAIEELVRNLLHTQRVALSNALVCFQECRKTWGDSGVYHPGTGTWCVGSRYLFRASVMTDEVGLPG